MIYIATYLNKTSCLILSTKKDVKYYNSIIQLYNEQPLCVRNKIYIIEKRLNRVEISNILKTSHIYIHTKKDWDEARLISEALLCGCMILCHTKLIGHSIARKKINAFVEYNDNNIYEQIKKIILKKKHIYMIF